MKDPYSILGVAKTATEDEIKRAYRNLAKKHHPDLNPGNKEAEAKFKDISAAYEQIGNAEARAKFDRGETEAQHQERARERSYYQSQQAGGRYSSSFGQGSTEDDFFANLFRRQARTDYPGEDQLYHLEVDFRAAALGAEREITLPSGKKLSVKIPAGINTGAKLRFRQQGGPGVGSGPPGDAYVEISVKSMPGFTRSGNNIETELPLSFQEAILGAEIKTPTLDGNVMLKVPAGTSSGARLRIRGKGVGAGDKRGDQIVIAKIVLPRNPSPELQEAIRNLGTQFSYDPRNPEGGAA